jgi:putative aldouronate transport system substrate-binding protein
MKTHRIQPKSTRLVTAILLCFVICFSGCQGSNTSSTANTANTANPSEANSAKATKSDPIDITWYWAEGGNIQVPEDSFICKKIFTDLGIRYVHISPKGNDFTARLQVLIASQEIPDVMESYTNLTTQMRQNGLIIPVGNYMTPEYIGNVIRISNNWDKAVEMERRSDGHIWAIPCTNSTTVMDVPWIRYDWLSNLGLQVPKTYDELRTVLEAFTHNDPDRNGADDTVGTMLPGGGITGYSLNFACHSGGWYKDGNGGVDMGMFLPRQKDLFKYIKSLLDSGACDKEMATTSGTQLIEKIKAGKVGFCFYWGPDTKLNDDICKVQPSADWRPMPPPTGLYGAGYLPSGSILRSEYTISASCTKLDAVFRLMNYMADDRSTADKFDYSGTYWEVSYGRRGVNWDITTDGRFDMGNFSAVIKKQNQIDNYVGFCRRWRSKNGMLAVNSGLREDEKRDNAAIGTYPMASDIPPDDPLALIQDEGVDYSENIVAFTEQYNNIKWPEIFYSIMLGNADIDTAWQDFVDQAYKDGYSAVKAAAAQTLINDGALK